METIMIMIITTMMTTMTTGKIIDLSHKHGPDTPMSARFMPSFNHTVLHDGDFTPGMYVNYGSYFSGEHGGTHMDAPLHFTKDGQTLDEIPLENTIADGVMIDCTRDVKQNEVYPVPIQKILDWESENGRIPDNAAVLFNFGWSSRFSNESLYRGTETPNNITTYRFPYVPIGTAKWLDKNRNVLIWGSDTLTVDSFFPQDGVVFPIHQLVLPKNRLIIENLRDLDKLPARGFRFHASPVKYVGLSGAQVRAFAMTYEGGDGNGGSLLTPFPLFVMSCVYVVFTLFW